jgi:hypothetical protein
MCSQPSSGLSLPAFMRLLVCLLCADVPPSSGKLSVMYHAIKSCRVFHFVCIIDEVAQCLFFIALAFCGPRFF